jgi:hypothetical protein|nr:T9SS type A sorting domain-containing protein [Bacteroidales bacterium]
LSIDTVSFQLRGDTLWNNPDTTFVVNYLVDSIYVDSYFVKVRDVDYVFLDTTFVDSTRIWGTYEYVETDTLYSSTSRQTTEVVNEDTVSEVYWEDYVLYDTILVTAINPVETLENITIFSDAQYIHVNSSEQRNMNVKVFSMSGVQMLSVILSSGTGVVQVPVAGVYIVCVEQGDHLMTQKIIIHN